MITIRRYDPATDREAWDAFVADSRNASFLFYRGYMDYHSDRFADYSLMAYDGHDRLLAVLPACREGATLYSHRGLTFGGWLLPRRRCDALDMLEIFDALASAMRLAGIEHLVYKAIPYIYSRQPAQEDIYAMTRAGARITTSLVSSVIDLRDPIPFDMGSRQRARKAAASGIVIGESDRWDEFWGVLTELLRERFDATPVHSLDEIRLLRSRFPSNIRLVAATDPATGEILAGIVLYINDTAIHSQYTAATPRGKQLSVVPALYQYIIDTYRDTSRWLDLGTSNEDGGREVNPGLLRQKCSYGARAVAYLTFTLDF